MDDSNREEPEDEGELHEEGEMPEEGEHEEPMDHHEMEATNHHENPGVETLSQVLKDKERSLKLVKERRKQVERDAQLLANRIALLK